MSQLNMSKEYLLWSCARNMSQNILRCLIDIKDIIYIIDIKENKSISNFGAKSIEILYNCYRIYVKYILSWNRRYIGIS